MDDSDNVRPVVFAFACCFKLAIDDSIAELRHISDLSALKVNRMHASRSIIDQSKAIEAFEIALALLEHASLLADPSRVHDNNCIACFVRSEMHLHARTVMLSLNDNMLVFEHVIKDVDAFPVAPVISAYFVSMCRSDLLNFKLLIDFCFHCFFLRSADFHSSRALIHVIKMDPEICFRI